MPPPQITQITPPSACQRTRRTPTPTRIPPTPRTPPTTRTPTPTRRKLKTSTPTNSRSPTPTKSKSRTGRIKRPSAIPHVRLNTSTTIASTKTTASSVTSVTSPSSSTWSSVTTSVQPNARRKQEFRKREEELAEQQQQSQQHRRGADIQKTIIKQRDSLVPSCIPALQKDASIEEEENSDDLSPPKDLIAPVSKAQISTVLPPKETLCSSAPVPPTNSSAQSTSDRRTSEPLLKTLRTLDFLEQKWKQQKITSPLPASTPKPQPQPLTTIAPTNNTPNPTNSTDKKHLSSLALAAARGRRRSTSEGNNASTSTSTHYELLEQRWQQQKCASPLFQRSASLPRTPPRPITTQTKKSRTKKKKVQQELTPAENPPVKVIMAGAPEPSRTPPRPTSQMSSRKPPRTPPRPPPFSSSRVRSAPPRTFITPSKAPSECSTNNDDDSSVSTLSYDSAEEHGPPPPSPRSSSNVFDRLYHNTPRLPSLNQHKRTSNASVGISLGVESKGGASKGVSSLDRRSFGRYFNSKRESKIPSFGGKK